MVVKKILLLEKKPLYVQFFNELFEYWGIELKTIPDLDNALIQITIQKPHFIILSSDLETDYKRIFEFIFAKNYPVIAYGKKEIPIQLRHRTLFLGQLGNPTEMNILELKQMLGLGEREIKRKKESHIDTVLNKDICVIEISGKIIWEEMHRLKYALLTLLEEKPINGFIFIFGFIENAQPEGETALRQLFSFLKQTEFDINYVKYILLEEKLSSFFSSDILFKNMKRVSSYAEAYAELKSKKKDNASVGIEVRFLRPESLFHDNLYDIFGKLVKPKDTYFSKQEIEKLKKEGIDKLFTLADLYQLGVDVPPEIYQEFIESNLIRQAEEGQVIQQEQQNKKKRILIVDDDMHIRKLLEHFMKNQNYDTYITENVKEGLAYALNEHPDLILLDLYMPEINGGAFFKQYKETMKAKNLKEAPVIVMSAISQKSVVETFLKSGVKDYIVKPLNLQVLLEKIKKVIG